MSAKVFASLGLTVGLGVGTAYAVHEVGELNAEAARIEACVEYNEEHELPNSSCDDIPASAEEVTVLRSTAETTGQLGWVAFVGTVGCGFMTAELIQKKQ